MIPQQKVLAPFPIQSVGDMQTPLVQWYMQSLVPRVDNSLQSVALTGDITGAGGSTFSATINPGAVTLGKMAPLAPVTLLGNSGVAAATPQALTPAQVLAMLPAGGDLAGVYTAPTVSGVMGKAIPALATGNLRVSGTAWTFDATVYAQDSAVVHNTGTETINGAKTFSTAPTAPAWWVSGIQVIGAQQTGLGATLGAATAGGTYTAAEQTMLQNAYNKLLALETKLKLHGLVAT